MDFLGVSRGSEIFPRKKEFVRWGRKREKGTCVQVEVVQHPV